MGAEGVEGAMGFAGLPGPAGPQGSEGPAGSEGSTGATGPEGPAGYEGPKGSSGATGPEGPAGSEGPRGSAGSVGSEGATGPQGPTGPEGPPGLPAYAEFYALMPPNNAVTVGAGMAVEFPQDGPTSGVITRRSASELVLPQVGTYRVAFSVSVDEPGQLVLGLDSGSGMVELPYTVYGRATGTSLISGEALVTTTATNSVVELRNPTGNTPALTITPKAGGAHAAVASIVVQQLG
jgi:Collagen triple helix repeat (20 copies)